MHREFSWRDEFASGNDKSFRPKCWTWFSEFKHPRGEIFPYDLEEGCFPARNVCLVNILWSRPPPSRPSQRKILPSFAQLQPPPCKHPLPDCQPDRPLRRMQHFSAGFGPATDTSQNDRRRHASAPAAVTTATTAKDDAPRAMGEPRPRRRAPATASPSGCYRLTSAVTG